MYSIIHCQQTYDAAQQLARGVYQSNILAGREALSGATLRGKAKRYADRYQQSASNLLARCRAAGLCIYETRGAHGKRVLVIGGEA